MIDKLIKDYVIQASMDEEDIEIIIYGFKILGTSILTALIIILTGLILGQVIPALIYLSVLVLLRRNVGGYHSKTYLGCLLITMLNFMIIVVLGRLLTQNYKEIIGILFMVYSTIKIYNTKPQVHKNRIVSKEALDISNMKKNINLSIILFITILFHLLIKLEFINEINYFFAISSSLMIVALSINKIDTKEEDGNEKIFN